MNGWMESALLMAVLDAAVRGTLILFAALGATALMRRSSASARHLVWLAALAALLLLPVARGFVPEWRVLPLPTTVLAPRPAETPPLPTTAAFDAAVAVPAVSTATAPAAAGTSVPEPFRAPADWKTLALLAWAAGAALFGVRLAFGLARVWWLERRAAELTDEEWVRLTDGLSRRLRLGRIVRLLRDPAARVPMTWGIFHPVILLPAGADGWEGERRRAVLAHELAHVRRWDALTQWIAHVAVAVYWFNPLVWMAARKLREEREHACDDAVLEIGTAPADYADHLLTIVRSLGSAPGPAAALAMARRSQFEGRLLAILDNAVRRNGVSRAAALATSAAALACLLPLAAMRPAERVVAALGAEEGAEQPASSAVKTENGPERATSAPAPAPARLDAERDGTPGSRAIVSAAGALLPEAGAGTAPALSIPADAAAPGTGAAGLLRELETRPDPGVYAEIIRAAERIGSSTDRRLVFEGLLEKPDLSHANVVGIIGGTRTMDSDVDKRLVLNRAVRHRSFRANPLAHVYYEALRTFTSATDQRLAITTLLDARRLDGECLELLFRHLARLDSDVDERMVLVRAAQTQRVDGGARRAYVDAVGAIGSDVDRRLALTALGDPPAASPRSSPAAGSSPDEAEGGERVWDGDISLELGGRDVEIHAKGVVFGRGQWDIRRINAGGSLRVQEARGGTVRRLAAVPGPGGRPVWTYTVDGVRRDFDTRSRSWMEAIIREFTGS